MLAPLTDAAIFLVLTINPGGEDACRDLLADWPALRRSVGFRAPGDELACVAAIGSQAWDRLFAGPRPADCTRSVSSPAPAPRAATPGDLLFHIRHERMDLCFEFASQALTRLAGAVTVVDEVHGFRFFDERDLLGFVDGTENPDGRAAAAAALVGEADRNSPAAATSSCRSTCTTWTPGTRCRPRSRSRRSAATSCPTSSCRTRSSLPTPTSP